MSQRARRILILGTVAFGALVLLPILSGSAITFYTDWLWFDSVGQLSTFKTRLLSRAMLWVASALIVLAVLAVNWFFLPRRLLGRFRLRIRGQGGAAITIGARLLTIILSVVGVLVALTMASAAAEQWMTTLKFIHASPFDVSDPIFGFDVSFYIFKLPFYRFLVSWTTGLIVVVLIGNALIYVLAGRIREAEAIGHLSVLGALFLVTRALGYQLQRWGLLQSSGGVVYGASYTDVHARMPLLYLLTGVVVVGAIVLLVNIWVRRWRLLLGVGGAWLALSLLGQAYPTMVQRFTVEPNELALERPFIQHNIRFTRYAYGLDGVQEFDYQATGDLTLDDLEDNEDTLDNVRLWDWRPLRATYEQIQEIRTYYTFVDIDIDRYMLEDRLRQVNLAVRELDIEQMREDARTWINQHLIYTHGYGLCLSPVAEVSEEGLPRLLVRNIPPQSENARLQIERPEIYFGEKTANYAIVNTTEDEFDYPSGDQNVYARYQSSAGVSMGGLLRRTAFALRFSSSPILLSNAVSSDSRILFHRALTDRAETLAPMLWFDADPYPVIADGRIVWLYDAYTWSSRFPYSRPANGLNYIRNSVKVTVDAYTGETTFYVVDPGDPVIQTYQTIFPDLFTSGTEMDPVLRDHWRYPEQLFRIQADLYSAYHMEDPRVFYNQEDLWQTPMEIRESETAEVAPYYVTMRLPGSEQVEFMMIRPYVPAGKQNMIAWLYADSDGSDYGKLGVYKFSKEALVYGPMQVESRIDQDPTISEQLTLWNQRGSSVNRGNLIVIPIDGALLYVEPLYLQAEASRLPELKRVVVSYRNRVAMANSLSTALAQVLGVTPVTQGPGQAPDAGQEPTEVLPTDVRELAQSAQGHYEAAQQCLQDGDWTCYGEELEAMERDLQALLDATGQ
jgi:uncharacterized membrane protein (UPF0182 family)